MNRKVWLPSLLFLMYSPAPALSYAPNGQPCVECHSLTLGEAKRLLAGDVDEVTAVRESDLKGFWSIEGQSRGKRVRVFVDFSKKHLIKGYSVVRVDPAQIPLEDAVVLGQTDAPIRVVVFDDPECPYCRKLQPEMKRVVELRPDVSFWIKMFPLPNHPNAKEKARAIVCERSLALLDDSLAGKELPAAKCDAAVINENVRLGNALGIGGTPALILPEGQLRTGYRSAEQLLKMLPERRPGQP